MNLKVLVWREIRERPAALVTTGAAIVLGVAALVAMRHITFFSEREVGRQLSALGANVLVLPSEALLQSYYAADQAAGTIPEEYAAQILLANLPGVERLSPKLSMPISISDCQVTLTGILPQSEFEAKSAWQTATMFKKQHVGCKRAACGPKTEIAGPEAIATQRTIDKLADFDVVAGVDAAEALQLEAGDSVTLLGESFNVIAVLPSTGTIDDGRLFAHLHTVQRLAKAGEVVSAIEVMGCCEDAAGDLVPELRKLLPDTKVVTVSQVVETQMGVNRLLSRLSLLVVAVFMLVGGASVAGTITANVRERRREIGTWMALGASPGLVARMFLMKALWLGLAGSILGAMAGMLLALVLGPRWAGVSIEPLYGLIVLAVAITMVLTVVAAYWPARQAAKLDPCLCFRES
ncbi:MAG: ABC transporter permease [Pirellulales bacterium]